MNLADFAARAADPARALERFEELVAAGLDPASAPIERLLRILGASSSLSRTLAASGARAGAELDRLIATDRMTAEQHLRAICAAGAEVPTALRRHKRQEILRIGGRDLLGLAAVTDTVRELSALADGSIEAALRHARLRAAEELGRLGGLLFVVFGMGKLGGGELNFSSDIDLIYLFDDGAGSSSGGSRGQAEPFAYAARIAEIVTRVLTEKTEDGFAFRVDLRLRPDGQSGPIVNSLAGALTYYESWGQAWERGAMLKARAVAGDLDLGQDFLREMAPFVYRRYLDYESLAEIESLKRRVDSAHAHDRLERNVKLGPGGIREIEFIVQANQLVHGGRDDRLRTPSTVAALGALAEGGLLPRGEADRLRAAYWFLRDVEHKIQIVDERQTHLLPTDPEEETRLARRLAYHERSAGEDAGDERARFVADLAETRARVRQSFETLFARPDGGSATLDPELARLIDSREDAEALAVRLASLGFRDAVAAAEDFQTLRDGSTDSPPSPRRRRALAALIPTLVREIRSASDPDLALRNMVSFLGAVGARTSFLALLKESPKTLRLLVGLFGTSQYLSNFFIRHPELIDSLVRADLAHVHSDRETLERKLATSLALAEGFEAKLDAIRRFRNEEFFRIGVNDIHGLLELSEAGEELTRLAEVALRAALGVAAGELEPRFGPLPGRFVILGMGKLGGGELTYNSDLDLIFVYSGSASVTSSGPIPAPSIHEVFTRLAQRLITALQATTREGFAYKVDTRLRPSGSAGPLVSSLEAFREYHRGSARLWERQALIRARAVGGDEALSREVERIVETFVYGNGLSDEEAREIDRLRTRMERELAGEGSERLNLKTGRGGIVDIEFLTQMLQLRHGHDHPEIRLRQTDRALEAIHAAGFLGEAHSRALLGGYRFLRQAESRLRLERDQPVEAIERQGPALASLARRMGYAPESGAAALLRDFERVREEVRSIYRLVFGGTAN